jgi:hypothetical protein
MHGCANKLFDDEHLALQQYCTYHWGETPFSPVKG